MGISSGLVMFMYLALWWVGVYVGMQREDPRLPWEIEVRCYYCDELFKHDHPNCVHPEVTPLVSKAAGMLAGVDFCDHFCCGMPENLCRAVRLAEELKGV